MRHNSWRGTKHYRFNGQVVVMRKNGVLRYLNGDRLGSTVLTTNSSGAFSGQELRHDDGRDRAGAELGTENRFTGQKLDGAGLMYFNARLGLKPKLPIEVRESRTSALPRVRLSRTSVGRPAIHCWATPASVKEA